MHPCMHAVRFTWLELHAQYNTMSGVPLTTQKAQDCWCNHVHLYVQAELMKPEARIPAFPQSSSLVLQMCFSTPAVALLDFQHWSMFSAWSAITVKSFAVVDCAASRTCCIVSTSCGTSIEHILALMQPWETSILYGQDGILLFHGPHTFA